MNRAALVRLARIQDDDCIDDPLPSNHLGDVSVHETMGSLQGSLSRCFRAIAFQHEKRRAPYFGLDRHHSDLTAEEPMSCLSLRDQRVANAARLDAEELTPQPRGWTRCGAPWIDPKVDLALGPIDGSARACRAAGQPTD